MALTLPHYAEGEKGVLGSILLSGQWVDRLHLDLFYLPQHQKVYRLLERLRFDGKPLDLVAVLGESQGSPLVQTMVQLPGAVTSLEAVPGWVELLKEFSAKRRLALAAAEIAAAAESGDYALAERLIKQSARRRPEKKTPDENDGDVEVESVSTPTNEFPTTGKPEKLVKSSLRKLLEKKAHARTLANEVLRTDSRWEGVLWYDDFRKLRMLGERAWTDADEQRIAIWLSQVYGIEISAEALRPITQAIAADTTRDPLKEYLLGLRWDGEARIDTWLQWGMGVADTPIYREIGRMWLVQAVARALRPGVQADATLVLLGSQGEGKTSTLRELVSRPFWSESEIDIGNSPRCYQQVAAAWVHELGEMAAFLGSRIDQNAAKTFLTAPEDNFIPLHGRAPVKWQRRSVFVGTTNRPEILRDPTGARRFWPVETGQINRDLVIKHRDQLWAEAVSQFRRAEAGGLATYQEGLSWWLPRERWGELQEIQADYKPSDSWLDRIVEWLADPQQRLLRNEPVTSRQLLVGAIGKPLESIQRADENRIGDIMRELGWKHLAFRSKAAGGKKVYGYRAPEEAEPETQG